MSLQRAYSVLHVKAVSDERREFSGIATTPEPDRMGDVVEPKGIHFKNPLPLLLFHDNTLPVGTVKFGKPTDDGVEFTASIPDVTEPGRLKDRVDEAWQSVKYKIVRGVSIGFRVLGDGWELLRTGGVRFIETEVLELSLVAIPANAQATIQMIKSIDAKHLAALGTGAVSIRPQLSGVTDADRSRTTARKDALTMKTITEQIKEFQSARAAKAARQTELMTKAGEAGVTLDEAQEQEYDTLTEEIKKIDSHLVRLDSLEKSAVAATPAQGANPQQAAASRDRQTPHAIQVKSNLPPGIEFSRMVLCKLASFASQGSVSPLEVAKHRYPDNPRIQDYLTKAAVPAGTTSDPVWAGPLVDTTNLASEFLEYLRPQTIIGKFGTGNIPSLRRVPFNVRITGQASGGNAYWVGQGAPKPLTSFAFNAQTLLWAKVAAIAVITEELARFSSPSAETLVRDALRDAIVERLDVDFIDPAQAAVAGVNPASITFGVTPLATAGATADNVRTDIQNLLEAYIASNQDVSGLVIIMPNTLALALSVMVNTLGQREFPDMTLNGGTIMGLPVITSQYAANQSGSGNLVIAVNARFVALADDGQVSVDASREASLQMLDNPTNNSATGTATSMVSMFQTNSIALRAERFINWGVLRSGAVQLIDDANWGSIGSP
jgi:HK97 family phage major capsid protein/HK97 family phage prohead protease